MSKSAIDSVISQVHKQFGDGSLMRMGSVERIPVEVIPTGSISLDMATGVGGFPKKRISELWGDAGAGKTTIALHAIAQCQKAGGTAVYIDVEHALDPIYAAKIGVDVDNLILSQPDYGEQALEIVNLLVQSEAASIIVVDSVAALVPKAELDGEVGDVFMGLQARLMSQAMRKLTGIVSKSNTCLLFINQVRDKIGVSYGDPSVTTGGKALKFYASMRMQVSRTAYLKDGDDKAFGSRTKVKIVKNKLSAPFKEAEFDIIYGLGISREGDVLDRGVDYGIVEKAGSWYSYKGEKIGGSRDKAKKFLSTNSNVLNDIEEDVLKHALHLRGEVAVAQ